MFKILSSNSSKYLLNCQCTHITNIYFLCFPRIMPWVQDEISLMPTYLQKSFTFQWSKWLLFCGCIFCWWVKKGVFSVFKWWFSLWPTQFSGVRQLLHSLPANTQGHPLDASKLAQRSFRSRLTILVVRSPRFYAFNRHGKPANPSHCFGSLRRCSLCSLLFPPHSLPIAQSHRHGSQFVGNSPASHSTR